MSDIIESTNELPTPSGDGEGLPTSTPGPQGDNPPSSGSTNPSSSGEETGYNEQQPVEEETKTEPEVVAEDAPGDLSTDESVPDDAVTGFQPPTTEELTQLGLNIRNELGFPFNLIDMDKYTEIFQKRDMTSEEVADITKDVVNNMTKVLSSRNASEAEISTTVGVVSTAVDAYINMIGQGWEAQRKEEQAAENAREAYVKSIRESTSPEQIEKAKTLLDSLNGQEQMKFEDFLLNDYKDNPGLVDKLIAGDDVVDELEKAIQAFKTNPNTLKNFLKDLSGPAKSKAALVDYAYKELGMAGTPPTNPTDAEIKHIVEQIRNVKGSLLSGAIPKGLLNKDITDILNKINK
jgi:hypothetical protein